MNWFTDLLRKLGIVAPFSQDDVLEAENEDYRRDIEKRAEQLKLIYSDQTQSNTKLRNKMQAVRRRAATFAQFEERIRNEHSARSK